MLRTAILMVASLSLSALAIAQEQGTAPGVRTVQDVYRLGIQMHAVADRGIVIDAVNQGGPATELRRADNTSVIGILDPGDCIVAIEGRLVRSVADYDRAMQGASQTQGRLLITVQDVRTGALMDWIATAQLERVALRPPVNFVYRLGFEGIAINDGLKIRSLNQPGPMTRLNDGQGGMASAEVGDVVTAIDGVRINSFDQYFQQMSQVAGDGTVRVTLRDVRTGIERNWTTRSDRVQANQPPPSSQSRKVHMLFCGLTDDRNIGDAISNSVEKLRTIFLGNVDSQFVGSVEVLTGRECNASTIIDRVDRLQASADDTILVYYLGHGAYDPNLNQNDPSGGHFFQIPSGDLPRKTLFDHINRKGVRLSVLITDTCNVRSVAQPKLRLEKRTRQMLTNDFTPVEKLLLFYRGQIDLSASSRDQYSWFTAGYGGWFSNSFAAVVTTQSDWQTLLRTVSEKSNQYFHDRKEMLLSKPGDTSASVLTQLRGQTDMLPQAFRFNVQPSNYAGAPPQGPRTLSDDTTIEIYVE